MRGEHRPPDSRQLPCHPPASLASLVHGRGRTEPVDEPAAVTLPGLLRTGWLRHDFPGCPQNVAGRLTMAAGRLTFVKRRDAGLDAESAEETDQEPVKSTV